MRIWVSLYASVLPLRTRIPCHLMMIIINKKQTKNISNVLYLCMICVVCILMDMLVNCVDTGGHVCR